MERTRSLDLRQDLIHLIRHYSLYPSGKIHNIFVGRAYRGGSHERDGLRAVLFSCPNIQDFVQFFYINLVNIDIKYISVSKFSY